MCLCEPASAPKNLAVLSAAGVIKVVATLLHDPARHAGATYEFVSAERFTVYDLGSIIAKVTGRDISF